MHYKDTAFKIKTLSCHQRILEKKRNQKKSEYQLQVGRELLKTIKQRDRRPFLLCKNEYDLSIHFVVERDDELQQRIFTNKMHPPNQICSIQWGCNCSVCKYHFCQCLQKTMVSSRLNCVIQEICCSQKYVMMFHNVWGLVVVLE